MRTIFLYNPKVVQFDYGMTHPFRLERLWLTEYICGSLGLFSGDRGRQESFEPVARDDLLPAHDSSYLDALEGASEGLQVPGLASHGLGSGDNPVFPGLWEYSLYTAGGSLRAADLLGSGKAERVFHPGGGLHHAMPARASGFCYVNDVVLAIRRLLDEGRRVFYLDIDAHHGDGVQAAFYETNRVMTVSVHQDGRTLFPGTGFPEEVGRAEGTGFSVNVPLLPHMSDSDYMRVCEEIILPLLKAFEPDVLVTELGADSLRGDPLTNLEFGLPAWWETMERIASWKIPWLAVGGGGYDLANAMRAWSLTWMAMVEAGRPTALPAAPKELPGAAVGMSWPADFWAAPTPGSMAGPGDEAIAKVIEWVRTQVFRYHGL